MVDSEQRQDAASEPGEPTASRDAASPQRSPEQPAPTSKAHRVRGGLTFAVGVVGAFLVMARQERLSEQSLALGPWIGIVAVLLAVIGLLDLLGLFAGEGQATRPDEAPTDWRRTSVGPLDGEPVWMAPIATAPAALALFVSLALGFGVDGLPVAVLSGLAVLAVSAIRRPALLVFCVGSAIVLPFLGAYGLWDPWETHYGEVAREILSRDDWISLWWAQEDWFWSKPILIFWIEALSMAALGVDFRPDANPAHPEWAIRLPHYFLTIGALLATHALVQRTCGKRAGMLAALVLCTMPHFFFLSHQAITDMPFVATMTMAIAMLGLAVQESPEREVQRYRIGPIEVSAQHAVIGALGLVCLPQILLLASRNVTLVTGGFAWHRDRFMFGSAGNGGNPGNAPIREVAPVFDGIAAQPMSQAAIYLVGFVLLLLWLRRERRAQALYMAAFYFFCALSFMAKGIPGFALPGLVALFWLIATRRWSLLLDGTLRVARGILIVAVVGLPWYVAMYVRHGQGFTDRLLVHDHINRLAVGVHGDTGSVEYFLEQLGYGIFPWVALAPLAIAGWLVLGRREAADAPRGPAGPGEVLTLVGLWGTSAFVLFSAMTTKFHHYIFPAVPACGMLAGVALDRLMGPAGEPTRPSVRGALGTVLAVLAPAAIAVGIAGRWGDVRGVVPEGVEGAAMRDWALEHPWPLEHTVALVALGVGMLGLAWWLLRARESRDVPGAGEPAAAWPPVAASAGLFAAPAIASFVGRDLSWATAARPYGYERLIHLFVYNYGRPWPEHLDYRPMLTGFAITAATLVGLAAMPVVRQVALRAFLGVALAFAVWCLDVYMIDLSPHWGQRELFHVYYERRASADEPVIAWQMNWKGENFYTGNRVFAFVDLDNRRLQEWVRAHRGSTAWFVLEHTRLASLRSVLRGAAITPVTDARLNNKFVLVRAVLP